MALIASKPACVAGAAAVKATGAQTSDEAGPPSILRTTLPLVRGPRPDDWWRRLVRPRDRPERAIGARRQLTSCNTYNL